MKSFWTNLPIQTVLNERYTTSCKSVGRFPGPSITIRPTSHGSRGDPRPADRRRRWWWSPITGVWLCGTMLVLQTRTGSLDDTDWIPQVTLFFQYSYLRTFMSMVMARIWYEERLNVFGYGKMVNFWRSSRKTPFGWYSFRLFNLWSNPRVQTFPKKPLWTLTPNENTPGY